MKKILHLIIFFAFAFGLGSLGYVLASAMLPWPAFAGLYRMVMYHAEHPFQYIALIAAFYALVASIWAWTVGAKQKGLVRWMTISALIPTTILLASFPGGMLWSWHDMQAGFVPTLWFGKLLEGGEWGLETGWLVVGLSIPYNICGTVVGVALTDIIERRLRRTNDGWAARKRLNLRAAMDPVRLCRMEPSLVAALRDGRGTEPFSLGWSLLIVIGMAAFGAAFGCWRSPWQALYGAIKMPLMLHAVVWLSVAANTMLNWLLGGGLSVRQVRQCVLGALSISAVLLASLAPVVAYFVSQAPRPGDPNGPAAYRVLLAVLVACVGAAGVVGYARLFRLLCALTPDRAAAWRVMVAWVLTTGLVGTQCSWLLSPFIQQPDLAITFWNPAAFSSNFFEHLWAQVVSPWLAAPGRGGGL